MIKVAGVIILALMPLSASALCTLLCSCTVSTSGVAFGTYNPLSAAAVTANGNVRVTCGGVLGLLVPYQIALSKGANAGNFSPRQMASGVKRLNYNLFTDGTYATVWGDGTGGTQTVSGSVSVVLLGGTSQDNTVYGRMPGSQTTVAPGTYNDTIQVTVTYQ